MDNIKMNMEILNVICAVCDYKKWICSDGRLNGRLKFDWYDKTEQYYLQIEKPNGMRSNRSDFDRVLSYCMSKEGSERLAILCSMEEDELEYFDWK